MNPHTKLKLAVWIPMFAISWIASSKSHDWRVGFATGIMALIAMLAIASLIERHMKARGK